MYGGRSQKDEEEHVKFQKSQAMAAAAMYKALSHPIRIWIVQQLAKEEHCVREFVESLDVKFATVSRHLAKLRQAQILTGRRRGREVWYGLNRKTMRGMLAALV